MAAPPVGRTSIRVTTTARGQEVTLDGRVDVHIAADLRLALHAVLADGTGDLYLDLGAAEIGDATGLGVLLESHHRARRHGRRLVLGRLTPRSERLVRTARLHRVLHRAPLEPAVAPLTA